MKAWGAKSNALSFSLKDFLKLSVTKEEFYLTCRGFFHSKSHLFPSSIFSCRLDEQQRRLQGVQGLNLISDILLFPVCVTGESVSLTKVSYVLQFQILLNICLVAR